jgi:hypothetical protein
VRILIARGDESRLAAERIGQGIDNKSVVSVAMSAMAGEDGATPSEAAALALNPCARRSPGTMAKSAVAVTRAKAARPEASRAWLVSSPMRDIAWSAGDANGLKWMSLMTANVPLSPAARTDGPAIPRTTRTHRRTKKVAGLAMLKGSPRLLP